MALQRYADYRELIYLEIEFVKFYHYLIKDCLGRIDLEANLWFLNRVRDAYSKYKLQNGLSDIAFDCSAVRSAYIFSYAPSFTGSVVKHFLNLMHFNPWLLKKAITQKSLTITCLGGGPGAEVIAIAKAVEINLKMFCLNTKPITIHANIVDIDSGWKQIMKLLVKNWWKFFDSNYVRLSLSFVQFDLMQPLSEDLQEIVKRSDIVTMVNFVSAVYGTKSRERISKMLQEIIDHMDKNGVIFYVNCSRFSCIKELREVTSDETNVIYGPIYNDIYQLSAPCLRLCYDLYAMHFGREPPTIQCKNHVIAWCKVEKQVN